MDEADLIDSLKNGVDSTRAFIAELTNYHGGPVRTEYLLTSDIARAFLKANRHVSVETLNRELCNALACNDPLAAEGALGQQRTDVAVGEPLAPDALIEVKIRVYSFQGLIGDLNKLTDTINWMNAGRHRRILAASVFQIHFGTTKRRRERSDFEAAVTRMENELRDDLGAYATRHSTFSFELKPLHHRSVGIVDYTVTEDEDGTKTLDELGHATCYYAILIKHRRYGGSAPATLKQLKTESEEKPRSGSAAGLTAVAG